MTLVNFTIPEVDVLAECKEPDCTFSTYGDSATDAFVSWWTHRAEVHPEAIDPDPIPENEVESPIGTPPKPTD